MNKSIARNILLLAAESVYHAAYGEGVDPVFKWGHPYACHAIACASCILPDNTYVNNIARFYADNARDALIGALYDVFTNNTEFDSSDAIWSEEPHDYESRIFGLLFLREMIRTGDLLVHNNEIYSRCQRR